MSNIMSFDFHRKSLGELQREIERINIKLRDYEEWRVWQTRGREQKRQKKKR